MKECLIIQKQSVPNKVVKLKESPSVQSPKNEPIPKEDKSTVDRRQKFMQRSSSQALYSANSKPFDNNDNYEEKKDFCKALGYSKYVFNLINQFI